ncbi:MAG TPA: HEAT repeat domain-containing protein [Azospirillaceae bacterium]|nr:HEAT repeat domain-containing protein [Azospirillaceae bacterium]
MSDSRLLDVLNLHLFGDPCGLPPLPEVVGELGRRRVRAAVAPLLQLIRRHRGHDRLHPAPQVAHAAEALAAIGDPAAGAPLAALATEGAFSAVSVVAMLSALAELRFRPSAGILPSLLSDADPDVRRAACRTAAAIGAAELVPALEATAADAPPQVAAAAVLALGHLGWRPAKAALEASLDRAAPVDLPDILAALRPLADGESAVHIGRACERMDEAGRIAAVEVLADIGGPAAVAGIIRRVRDPRAAVRLAVAHALAGTMAEPGDAAKAADALARLLNDPDPQVAEAARIAAQRRDDWG